MIYFFRRQVRSGSGGKGRWEEELGCVEGGKLLLGYNVWEENQKEIKKNAGAFVGFM